MWEPETQSQRASDSELTDRRTARNAVPKEPRQLHPDAQLDPRRRTARSQKPSRTNSAQKSRQRSNRRERRLEVVPPANPNRRTRPERRAIAIAPRPEKPIALPRPKTRSGLAFLYGTRLLILGVGISVIAGTILSIWDPAGRTTTEQAAQTEQSPQPVETQPALPQLALTQEMLPLKTQIEAAINTLQGNTTPAPTQSPTPGQSPAPTQLAPGLMVVDLDTQNYVDINGSTAIAAASTIKFPLLVAFFQDVDAGKIRLDQRMTMRKELVAKEAGDMQFLPVGSQFPALEVATKMITISDNTATNMVIDALGGAEAVNQRFESWGLTNTRVRNLLPDLEGTNTSSPRDMATLLALVNSGKLMSLRASDRMLGIMRQVHNNSLLPQGLGEGALIAHKTGDIGSVLGDVGLVDMPNGKRYAIAALVGRPRNDGRAGELIQQMSRLTYRYLSQSTPASSAPSVAPASPAPREGTEQR